MQKRFVLVIKGVFLALILSVLFSLLLATLVYSLDIPDGLLRVLLFIVSALSAVFSAFAACKAAGSKGLLTGAAIGFLYYITLLIIAVIIKKDFSFDLRSVIMLFSALISGMLGGVLGMPR